VLLEAEPDAADGISLQVVRGGGGAAGKRARWI
jgi:hypothetical protein